MNLDSSIKNKIFKTIAHYTFNDVESFKSAPIVCAAFSISKGKEIVTKRNHRLPLKPRGEEKFKTANWMKHAENYVVERLIELNVPFADVILIVSFQPCNGCMRMLKRRGFDNVYYIVDKGFKSEQEERGFVKLIQLNPENSIQRRIYKNIFPIIDKEISKEFAIIEQKKIDEKNNKKVEKN